MGRGDTNVPHLQWYVRRSEIIQRNDRGQNNEVYAVPHSSPEVSAQFPILCMYLMGSNWSSAYRSASRGKLLLLLLCIVRLQLGSRWVRVRVSCRVRFSVRVSFTVRVSVRVIQVAILSCKLWGNSTTSPKQCTWQGLTWTSRQGCFGYIQLQLCDLLAQKQEAGSIDFWIR